MGVYRLQHESLQSIWSSGPSSRAIFPAAFGRNRFEEIVACLCFDNCDTRLQRRQTDKFAPFRCFWNRFIENCRKHYAVSAYVTIDEQLILFRGQCGFRQSMRKKPDKYEMKLFFMCDCTSGYTYNGLPYTGREGDTRRVGLAQHVFKTLCNPVHNSGINVTTDNWFTSTKLAKDLLLKQITLLETLRKNKPDIFKQFATGINREVECSLFGFKNRQDLVSYVLKKTKPWLAFNDA